MKAPPKAVILLSGGLDSATVLAIAREQGYRCYTASFDYGQRHRLELRAAERIAQRHGSLEHRTIRIDLSSIGGSALTADIEVPRSRTDAEIASGIPVTYVPARNTVFLSLALAWAEVLGALDIFIGVNAVDYSGYPDCRPEFIRAFEEMANLATRAAVEARGRLRVRAPIIDLSKAEIIRKGIALNVDYSLTHSCYDPTTAGEACGACDSCLLRRKGFSEAGVPDPTRYRRAEPGA